MGNLVMSEARNAVKAYYDDFTFMREALALAEEGLGRVAPNPSVGCVIVKNGEIIGKARSADGGRPHAETRALAMAGGRAKGATLYATLEPCGHVGQTGPCVDALIAAGIARVVIACRDPFQRENRCIERLESAGIAVTPGVCEEQALAVNEGFFTVLAQKRPLVTAKIATSLDGRIATVSGASKWITGEEARKKVHEFRARHDAVLAGVGTVLADDPLLNVRLPGHDFQPRRIVIDPALKTAPASRLAASAQDGAVWFLHSESAAPERRKILADKGARLIGLEPGPQGIFAPETLLRALAEAGITRLFVEGGGVTIAHLLKSRMIDRLLWFRAPKLIGGDGVPAFAALGVSAMEDALPLMLEEQSRLGEDLLEIWRFKG